MAGVPPLKTLAVFICGPLPDSVEAVYGDNTSVFQKLLTSSLPRPDSAQLSLHPYDVVKKMEYPPEDRADEYDGIILTGAAASAYEDVKWINKLVAYIRRIAEERPGIKILGACFGHQIVGRAFGSECVLNNGLWEMGPTPIELTELGKSVFGVESLNIMEMHQDHVPIVPPGFHLLGSTSGCYNQGMVRFRPDTTAVMRSLKERKNWGLDLKDIQILTMQGHPEYVEGIVSLEFVWLLETGAVGEEAVRDAESRMCLRHDGVEVVGKAFWGMLGIC